MRYIKITTVALGFVAPILYGLTPENVAANNALQRSAAALVRQNRTSDAVILVDKNVRYESSKDDQDVVRAQIWLNMAFDFSNKREGHAAYVAVGEARNLTDSLPAATVAVPARAALLCNLGYACERILISSDAAEAYYQAALVMQPGNECARERLNTLRQKKK